MMKTSAKNHSEIYSCGGFALKLLYYRTWAKYLSLNPHFSVTYVPGVVHYYVTLACRPQEFSTVAATQFGSGWAWLVDNHVTGHENTKGRKPPRSW